MARRRLIVVAVALAPVAVGAAWWLLLARLSAEEQRLVGVWRYAAGGDNDRLRVEMTPDRRVWWGTPGEEYREVGRWSVRGDGIVIDRETNPARRAVRPVALRLGVRVEPVVTFRFAWLTADVLTVRQNDGPETVLIRAPAH
jgi:hypothetical protein